MTRIAALFTVVPFVGVITLLRRTTTATGLTLRPPKFVQLFVIDAVVVPNFVH